MSNLGTGEFGSGTFGDPIIGVATVEQQEIMLAGVAAVYSAAGAAGDRFRPRSRVFLHVKNADESSIVVTPITTYVDAIGRPSLPQPLTIPAAGERMIGPFPAVYYKWSDGLMRVAYSAVDGVSVAVLTFA